MPEGRPEGEAPPRSLEGPELAVVRPPRRGPPRFHGLGFAVTAAGALVSLTIAALVHLVFYVRFEMRTDDALVRGLVALALMQVGVGFLAARVARKLCLLEHFLSALLAFGLAAAAGLGARVFLTGFDLTAGGAVGAAAVAAFFVLFFGFLGSSLGFLFGGHGRIDTAFSYETYIARRHLMAKKRTSFLSVITVISVLAVAVGVWCLTVVLSVMSGFEEDLKSKILGTNAHAVVLKYASAFTEWQEVADEVREVKEVVGVSPFILNQVMISSKSQVDGVIIKGILPEVVGEVTDLPKDVEDGNLDWLSTPEKIPLPSTPGEDVDPAAERSIPGIAIGKELARSLRVFVGDKVSVISPISNDMGPTGPVPRTKTFRVAAILYTGMYEYDSKFAYIHLKEAQSFFDMAGAVTGLELKTTDVYDTRRITQKVLSRIEGYPFYTKDWAEMNRNLFSALKLEKLVMAVILAFIVLVASFVILASLIMMVMEKGQDIAILKSMGARDASIMKIFVVEGLAVGVIGTILGVILGLLTCAFIASGVIGLDPEVYYIATLPVRVEPAQVVLVCIVAIVLSYLATIYPSVTASRLDPVEGLRNE